MNKDAKNTNDVSKQKLDFSNCLAANEGDLQEISRQSSSSLSQNFQEIVPNFNFKNAEG